MKRKALAVAVLMWCVSAVGGVLWGHAESANQELPATQSEIQTLQVLYRAKLFHEAVTESEKAQTNPELQSIRPEAMYVEWAAQRQLGEADTAAQIARRLLQEYPEKLVCADVHFTRAIDSLAAANYAAALTELNVTRVKYPGTNVAVEAERILRNLDFCASATKPTGGQGFYIPSRCATLFKRADGTH